MPLKELLARVTGLRRRERAQTMDRDEFAGSFAGATARGAGSQGNFLPGLRPVTDDVDAYFKDVYAGPRRRLPMGGGARPGNGGRIDVKAPKILPWIARRAGIGDELALKLWRRAAGESEELCGCCDGSDYYAVAVARFIDLVENESDLICAEPQAGTGSSWMWRHQRRMSLLYGIATRNIYRLWQSNWCNVPVAHSPAMLNLGSAAPSVCRLPFCTTRR